MTPIKERGACGRFTWVSRVLFDKSTNIFPSQCSPCIFCQMVYRQNQKRVWQFGHHHNQQWIFWSNLAVNRLFISNRSGITTTGLNLKTSKLSKLACAQVLPKSHDRLRGQVFKWIVNIVTSATCSWVKSKYKSCASKLLGKCCWRKLKGDVSGLARVK